MEKLKSKLKSEIKAIEEKLKDVDEYDIYYYYPVASVRRKTLKEVLSWIESDK